MFHAKRGFCKGSLTKRALMRVNIPLLTRDYQGDPLDFSLNKIRVPEKIFKTSALRNLWDGKSGKNHC